MNDNLANRKNKDCSCDDYNEYEIRLKCVKNKLHCRYISFISIGIVIWLLATGDANSEEFSSWISFASTVASIILSVIAIIMSISGDGKTDEMKNQMQETARKLEKTAQSIECANDQNIKNINELKNGIELLKEKIESLQGRTEEMINRYENTTSLNKSEVAQNSVNQNLEWEGLKNEK